VFRRYALPTDTLSATGREGRTGTEPGIQVAQVEHEAQNAALNNTAPMAAVHQEAVVAATSPNATTLAPPGSAPAEDSDAPIELPTSGLAPRWVGAIVVVSLVVVALVGLFLLR
jgi:hypothetical protein